MAAGSYTSTVKSERCRLCNREARRLDSHILAKSFHERILQRPDGRVSMTMIYRGTAVMTDKQITERLLCEECEQRFGRDERYIASLVLQDDGSFPWLDGVIGN